MLERLEKFEAPPAHHWWVAAPMLTVALLACNLDYASEETNAKIIAESTAKAVASQRASAVIPIPLAHPLGCPEEDEQGRRLKATVSIQGERRPHCIYTVAVKYGR